MISMFPGNESSCFEPLSSPGNGPIGFLLKVQATTWVGVSIRPKTNFRTTYSKIMVGGSIMWSILWGEYDFGKYTPQKTIRFRTCPGNSLENPFNTNRTTLPIPRECVCA